MLFPCISTPERRESKELEKKIGSWMKDYNKSIKLLLLGAGESGKTTIIKQMKILHINGFTQSEQDEKKWEIRTNILDSIVTLCRELDNLGITLANPTNQDASKFVTNVAENVADGIDIKQLIDEKFYDMVASLWDDSGIQETYAQQHKFQLIDCAKYFLSQINIIRQESYTPTVLDILNSRKRTTDIQRIEFQVGIPKRFGGGTQEFWMFDVGGQRGERKKWIQVFDGIQAVLFLVASNSFDLLIREDETTNRLEDALDIFENVWTSRFLQSAGFILFLNKQDKLKEKVTVEKKSIVQSYPEYAKYKVPSSDEVKTEDYEYIKTRCFIRDLFLDITRLPPGGCQNRKISLAPGLNYMQSDVKLRECYAHFTTATDTDNVKLVFEDVHDMIIMTNLEDIGIN